MRTAEGKDRTEGDEKMRKNKRARVEMDAGGRHDKPAQAKNEDEQMKEARGNGLTEQSADKSTARWEQQLILAGETEQQCWKCRRQSQTKYRWTHRAEKSAPTRGKDQGACRLSSQDRRNFSRRRTQGSISTAVATERLEKRQPTTLEWFMTS